MKIEEVIEVANELGYIIPTNIIGVFRNKEIEILKDELIDFLKKQNSILIDKEKIIDFLKNRVIEEKEENINSDIEVIYGTSYSSKVKGVNDFRNYLVNRYTKLHNLLIKKVGSASIPNISTLRSQLLGKNPPKSAYVIGMIYSKKIFEEYIILEIEDTTGRITSTLYKSRNQNLYDLLTKIPLDIVVGLKISVSKERRLFIDDIILPRQKIQTKTRNKDQEEPIYIALISDLHVGSKKFNSDLFDDFIDLMKGETDNEDIKNIIRRTYYVSIAGDIVDGVGVYPGQEKDLEIDNLWDQYDEAYRLLRKIPNKMTVIVIPGNHDASRNSLPQPPIFKKFAGKFYSDSRFQMLGNPANICLHGENMIVYHGDFIQDILSSTPGLDMEDIKKASKIMVETSHLAPTLTLNTKLFPEKQDWLIIPPKTRFIHFGHTHKFDLANIGGIYVFNTGTFQEQTNYQKMLKIVPDLGKVVFFDIVNFKPIVVELGS